MLLIELPGVQLQFTKAERLHATHKASMKTVVLESPVVHILASIVTHASELTNLSMQSPCMLVTSAAISNVFQSLRSIRSNRVSFSLYLSCVVVSRIRNQASRGQVKECPCRIASIACVCILESCSGSLNTFCNFGVMALQSANEFHLVRQAVCSRLLSGVLRIRILMLRQLAQSVNDGDQRTLHNCTA